MANQGTASDGAERSGRRRSRRSRSSRSNGLITVLGGLLGVSVFLLVAVAITLGGRISASSNENSLLSAELFKSELALKELRPKLAAAEKELAMLMEGRFPHLHTLEPDAVIAVQEQYLKNIVFTVVNQNGNRVYEYKLVMANPFSYAVNVNFRVLVFDKLGVQVGVDRIRLDNDLAIGESRSHSSALDVFMKSEPRYFAINFESPGDAKSAWKH